MGIVEAKEFETVSPLFRGTVGQNFARFVMRAFAIDAVNGLYDRSGEFTGAAFTASILKDLGVTYSVGNAGRLNQLPDGAFITISNHPYGGLDGIVQVDLFAGIRPEYRFMVNKILARVKAMEGNIIPVMPTTNKKNDSNAATIRGIRETLAHLRNGHPAGFFPSGAVSDFRLKDFRLRDREWQSSILRLIHTAKVPILPVRFFDANSLFYYFLGLISWRIRVLRLPSELFNKRGKVMRIGIGNIISIKEQEQFTDAASLGAYLRKAVYEMPRPEQFTHRDKIF